MINNYINRNTEHVQTKYILTKWYTNTTATKDYTVQKHT